MHADFLLKKLRVLASLREEINFTNMVKIIDSLLFFLRKSTRYLSQIYPGTVPEKLK